MEVKFDFNNYRQFIIDFRSALGVGSSKVRISSEPVDVICGANRGFRYSYDNLYLTHIRTFSGGAWKSIGSCDNYSQLGVNRTEAPITGQSIQNACLYDTELNGPARALVMVVTSEAARSRVVYQVIQQVLQGKITTWNALLPLLRNWGNYTNGFHKRRPVHYGPLGLRDYLVFEGSNSKYEEERATIVKTALTKLSNTGFHIDP